MALTKEKRDQLILTGLMSTMIIVGVWMLLITPTKAKLVRLDGEISASAGQLADAESKVARAGQIELEIQEIGKRLGTMEKDMVEGDPSTWIRVRLNEFVRDGQHKLRERNIGQPEQVEIGALPDFPYQAIKFKIYGTGFYEEVGRFITDLENTFPYVRVQQIDLRPNDAGDFGVEGDLLEYSFELVVPIKPTEKKS